MRGLICDDHPLMRQGLVLAVRSRWPGLELDEAASYPEAWERAANDPAFCLLDLAMPGAKAREGVARMRQLAPAMRIVVLTGLVDPSLFVDMTDLGVAGILPKTLEAAAVLDRIAMLVPELRMMAPTELPPRQREVLRLLAAGLTNKEIAVRLGIAPATVKIHVSRLIEQLGATNRTDAVSKAQRAGII